MSPNEDKLSFGKLYYNPAQVIDIPIRVDKAKFHVLYGAEIKLGSENSLLWIWNLFL